MAAPFTRISPNFEDSTQFQSNYVISFIPFKERDTYYNKNVKLKDALEVINPIIVVNDAVKISIHHHKGSPIIMGEILLQSGTVNYAAQVSPGDHAFVWLFNNQNSWDIMSNKIINNKTNLNDYNSGLKFVGRVNSVRQVLHVSNRDGKKIYRYHITLAGFTEFNCQIYYNEFLVGTRAGYNTHLQFISEVSSQYQNLLKNVTEYGRLSTEDLINFFIDVFMGSGPKDRASTLNDKMHTTPNAAFLVPSIVAQYLGLFSKTPKSVGYQYSDLLHRIMGIQVYSKQHYPDHKVIRNNYFQCSPLHGSISPPPMNFNNITVWSLLNRFCNPALNELYTVLKYNPNKKGIFPTLVLRQLPYTTDKMKNKYKPGTVTFFSNVHQWVIDNNYPIYEYNIGTSDAERLNFFQIYSNTISLPQDSNDPQKLYRLQVAVGNYAINELDIYRYGTRTCILTTDNDALILPSGQQKIEAIKSWVEMVADFYVNGHLKLNGSITVAGIQDPICIGDNLVFDNKIFHIEGIKHDFIVDNIKGNKFFTTTLMLSHGYYLKNGKPIYVTSTAPTREEQKESHLPGFNSEEMYISNTFLSTQQPQNNNKKRKRKK